MRPIDFIRPELQNRKPYSSARDEFEGEATAWLDANENPFVTTWNRYPDPLQRQLKRKLAELKHCQPDQLMLGNGSDEVLDLIFRLVGIPYTDKVAFADPSYGMYDVLATLNGLSVTRIPLDAQFQFPVTNALELLKDVKLLVICRPNNPTGNLIPREDIRQVLETFKGVVVVDEAYIDFCPEESLVDWVNQWPNLIVVQTLSKAYGMAGLRVGMAIADPEWIRLLNEIKPPYNLSTIVQETALELLESTDWETNRKKLLSERARLMEALRTDPNVREVFPSSANFILFRVDNASTLYDYLTQRGVVVRNRSSQFNCRNTLRVSVGSPEENQCFIQAMKAYEKE